MKNILINILRYLILLAISTSAVYFIFPNLYKASDLKNYYFNFGIVLTGVIIGISIFRYTAKLSNKMSEKFRKIAFWSMIIAVLFSVAYGAVFSSLTFECQWDKKIRFVRGSITTDEANEFILTGKGIGIHVPNIQTIDGACNAIHDWFPGRPDLLWTPDSIKFNEHILFYTLLILISSLIISLFFFVELKLLEYTDGGKILYKSDNVSMPLKREIKQIEKNEIKRLIADNQLEKSIDTILEKTENDEAEDLLIGLKQELNSLNSDLLKGVVGSQDKNIGRNNIRDKLLKILNKYF